MVLSFSRLEIRSTRAPFSCRNGSNLHERVLNCAKSLHGDARQVLALVGRLINPDSHSIYWVVKWITLTVCLPLTPSATSLSSYCVLGARDLLGTVNEVTEGRTRTSKVGREDPCASSTTLLIIIW